ncbi:tol-pal system protein YbgF [Pseudoalteromonas sp. YIC-827]|uniref:Cell division coordinator CpoB n=1 Tax=Pseudoalteromonas qingdaonensis TaxID=3131913 RepID=A0ABU9MXE0_9GAMM
MKPKLILAALLMSGSTHVWAAPAPVSEATASESSIEQRLSRLEQMMQSRNIMQANLQQQLDMLQDEVSQLRGITEEHSYKLEKVLQRQRELYQEIENRVSAAYTQQPSYEMPQEQTQQGDTGLNVTAVSTDLSENEAYDKAVKLIMQDKRYDAAIPEFQSFLQSYPNSVYAANAHYWLGQLLTIKGDTAGAKSHFETVVNQYSDSNKRPDALLKLGTLEQQQGQLAKAKQLFNEVITQYPNTTAAKLAAERVSKL